MGGACCAGPAGCATGQLHYCSACCRARPAISGWPPYCMPPWRMRRRSCWALPSSGYGCGCHAAAWVTAGGLQGRARRQRRPGCRPNRARAMPGAGRQTLAYGAPNCSSCSRCRCSRPRCTAAGPNCAPICWCAWRAGRRPAASRWWQADYVARAARVLPRERQYRATIGTRRLERAVAQLRQARGADARQYLFIADELRTAEADMRAAVALAPGDPWTALGLANVGPSSRA